MTISRILFAAAAVCFVVALVIVLDVITSGNATAWAYGGFLAIALGLLNPRLSD